MATRIIFRRIGGRIVPIRVPSVASVSNSVAQNSASIKKTLKEKIASVTSLAQKRIDSIRAVRTIKSIFRRSDLTAGGSASVSVPKPNPKKLVIKTLPRGQATKRALVKSVLSKRGLAPETFLVDTGRRRSYLVQKQVTTNHELLYKLHRAHGAGSKAFSKGELKLLRSENDLHGKIRRLGIEPLDLLTQNVGKGKKGPLTFDSGHFSSFKAGDGTDRQVIRSIRFLSNSERKRARKFVIKLPKKR